MYLLRFSFLGSGIEGKSHAQRPYERCCWGAAGSHTHWKETSLLLLVTALNSAWFQSRTFISLWNMERALALPKQTKLFPHLDKAWVGMKSTWTGQKGIPKCLSPSHWASLAYRWVKVGVAMLVSSNDYAKTERREPLDLSDTSM